MSAEIVLTIIVFLVAIWMARQAPTKKTVPRNNLVSQGFR